MPSQYEQGLEVLRGWQAEFGARGRTFPRAERVSRPCAGKIDFPTFADAAQAIVKNPNGGRRLSVAPYRCHHCHGFHLGGVGGGRSGR